MGSGFSYVVLAPAAAHLAADPLQFLADFLDGILCLPHGHEGGASRTARLVLVRAKLLPGGEKPILDGCEPLGEQVDPSGSLVKLVQLDSNAAHPAGDCEVAVRRWRQDPD